VKTLKLEVFIPMMSRGLPENRQNWVWAGEFSVLTTAEGAVTGLPMAGDEVALPHFEVRYPYNMIVTMPQRV
jgi:hypothetical protein